MSEERGITVPEAGQKIIEFCQHGGLRAEEISRDCGQAKVFDRRKMGSRRKRDEAAMIANCLKPSRSLCPAKYEGGSPGDELEVRIVRYMSGKETEPEAFRKRLARAARLRKILGAGQFMDPRCCLVPLKIIGRDEL